MNFPYFLCLCTQGGTLPPRAANGRTDRQTKPVGRLDARTSRDQKSRRGVRGYPNGLVKPVGCDLPPHLAHSRGARTRSADVGLLVVACSEHVPPLLRAGDSDRARRAGSLLHEIISGGRSSTLNNERHEPWRDGATARARSRESTVSDTGGTRCKGASLKELARSNICT